MDRVEMSTSVVFVVVVVFVVFVFLGDETSGSGSLGLTTAPLFGAAVDDDDNDDG